jgi:hypothetical protein
MITDKRYNLTIRKFNYLDAKILERKILVSTNRLQTYYGHIQNYHIKYTMEHQYQI